MDRFMYYNAQLNNNECTILYTIRVLGGLNPIIEIAGLGWGGSRG